MAVSRVLDAVLEIPIAPSFTRIGSAVRRRAANWARLGDYDLTGRVVVLTGGTSGIGRAAADQLAACGATLVLVGRSAERNLTVVQEIVAQTGNDQVTQVAADMGDLRNVHALADAIGSEHDRVDALLHNAGALSAEYGESEQGFEATVASQVIGPFLLTSLLLPLLEGSAPARVLTMSSGGMYSANLRVGGLQLPANDYNGTKQYALAKRAQVTLNEMWAERFVDSGVVFHALHPGWVDTPGVEEALPLFGKIVGPLLRTPADGADTLVWLTADDTALASSGMFWHDRRPRAIHRTPLTRNSDTKERRERLWTWVSQAAGLTSS